MSKFPCTRCLYSGQTFKSTSSAPAESDGAPRRTWPAAWADRVSNYPSAGWCGSSDSATGFLLCCLWTAAQSSLLRLCPTFCKPEERQNKRGGGCHKKQTKWGVKLFTTGQWQMVKSSFKEAIDNFSCHVESDENQLSKVPLDFFFFLQGNSPVLLLLQIRQHTNPHQYSEAHEVNLEPLPGYRGSSSPQSHAPPAAAAMGLLHNCCWKSAQGARRLR